MGAPVLLIQWLKPGEYRETRAVVKKFADKNPLLDLHDIGDKAAFLESLRLLAKEEDCQFLFIGSHGVKDSEGKCIGIGKSGTDFILWADLWKELKEARRAPVLWLGACSSSRCADAWSPFPSVDCAVKWLVGLDKNVYPKEIAAVLQSLVEMTSLNNIVYADQEIPRLQDLIPETSVQMHYPVHLNGEYQFLETSQFPTVFGKTFKEHLENK